MDLLIATKNGEVSDEEYEKIYREETLSKLNPEDIYKKYEGSVFLCYEVPEDFCHRQIVSSWLNESGFETKEFNNKRDLIEETKIAVIGSRDFEDYSVLSFILNKLFSKYEYIKIISGGARGADKLAEKYAKEHNIPIKVFKPEWNDKETGEFIKGAGFIRNKEIWDNSDLGIAFWNGKSKGTEHSISISKKQNKKFYIYDYVKKKWKLSQ